MSIEKICTRFLRVLPLSIAVLILFLSTAALASGVTLEVGADTPVIEVEKTTRVIVRALVKPSDVRPEAVRHAPLAVALVIDKSGSMASDRKMENARAGALEALRMLGGRDIASVVVYDSAASVLVSPTNAAKQDAFREAISSVRAGGSTALYDGVALGAKQLEPFVREGFVPRVIMLSDGQANVGPSTTAELSALGRRLAGREMTITTIGLGLDYNEDLMTALAAESGGNAYFARDARSLPDIFARDMEDAVALSARRVKATLVCKEVVTPVRAVGRLGERRGNSIEVNIDNLYGSEKYALFELEVPKAARASDVEAAIVKIEYIDPTTGKNVVIERPLRLSFTEDAAKAAQTRNVEIAGQAEIAKNAEIRDEAVRLADEGRGQEAAKLLRKRAMDLKAMPAEARAVAAYSSPSAPTVADEEKYFESLADSVEASGGMSNEQRKEAVNQSYVNKNQQVATSDDKKDDKK